MTGRLTRHSDNRKRTYLGLGFAIGAILPILVIGAIFDLVGAFVFAAIFDAGLGLAAILELILGAIFDIGLGVGFCAKADDMETTMIAAAANVLICMNFSSRE